MHSPYDILSPSRLDNQNKPVVLVRAGERITFEKALLLYDEGLDMTIAELISGESKSNKPSNHILLGTPKWPSQG